MSKRKGGKILADVDDSKKVKQELLPGKSTEEKPQEPAVETGAAEASDPNALEYLQIIVTGAVGCGKSCFVLSFMGQLFPPSHAEFLSKQYLHIRQNKQSVMIWDLDARSEFTNYRLQSYPEADLAFLCFDLKKPQVDGKEQTLEDVLLPWYNELEEHCRGIPIILVGLKEDLKVNSEGSFFSEQEINTTKRRLPRIELYKQVSSHMNKRGVKELFTQAIESIERPKPKRMFTSCGFEILGHRWLA